MSGARQAGLIRVCHGDELIFLDRPSSYDHDTQDTSVRIKKFLQRRVGVLTRMVDEARDIPMPARTPRQDGG